MSFPWKKFVRLPQRRGGSWTGFSITISPFRWVMVPSGGPSTHPLMRSLLLRARRIFRDRSLNSSLSAAAWSSPSATNSPRYWSGSFDRRGNSKRSNWGIVDSSNCGENSVGKNRRQGLHPTAACFCHLFFTWLCFTDDHVPSEENCWGLSHSQ